MPRRTWAVELSGPARRDYAGIVEWTSQSFGARQAHVYEIKLRTTLKRLSSDPRTAPSKSREELGPGYRTLRMADPGRHLILYRIEKDYVSMLRILHDSMDIVRHLPPDE